MDNTRVKAYFGIYGDAFPINEVTQLLNIEPTNTYNKGDVIVRPKNNNVVNTTVKYRKETAWVLSTDYQESYDVTEQLNEILSPLKNKSAIINRLKTKYNLECQFSIVIIMEHGYTPGLHLDNELIEFANSIKAEFDIDLYANPYKSDVN
ncbi:DUF4279 domain-containing protein [Paenibacillus sp. ATY16]|uniref:DUF4279 domain-containing protein n=1 Tax=Paenibacillus sp. ATY16 TaxID=1759312 RepID=UPI00200F1A78|nr:DUF4279 domain-containing protein [Paenibacillus sp. ATY16]MCK9862113.1 DUF4279 domain-containing protein [Paenibacillus sp. ATY16]